MTATRENAGRETGSRTTDRQEHSLVPDVLAPGLEVVFCGSALGDVSFRRHAYYANPGNRFWRTLAEVGLTPRRLAPEEYPMVTMYGIGLTDLVKTDHGQDKRIFDGHLDLEAARTSLCHKVEQYQPYILAFTSKTVAGQFLRRPVVSGSQPERLGRTVLWVLPSTSGLAQRFFDLQPWQELAATVHASNMPLHVDNENQGLH